MTLIWSKLLEEVTRGPGSTICTEMAASDTRGQAARAKTGTLRTKTAKAAIAIVVRIFIALLYRPARENKMRNRR